MASESDPMSDMAAHDTPSTIADYEAFVAARPEGERWELIGGVIEMMTNPYLNHGLIVGNLFAPLKLSLDRGECRAFAGGLRVQRSEDRTETFAAIPDLVVQCGPRPNRTYTTNAVVVMEVLSRSTMFRDRGAKFDFYRGLPTLRHIVFVYQGQMRVEHYRRTAEGWLLAVLTRPADRITLDAVDASIDLDSVYLDVPVLRPIETTDEVEDEPPLPIP